MVLVLYLCLKMTPFLVNCCATPVLNLMGAQSSGVAAVDGKLEKLETSRVIHRQSLHMGRWSCKSRDGRVAPKESEAEWHTSAGADKRCTT